jgi:predicted nucleic acid-binding protein
MFYLDSSVVVALIVNEPHSPRVDAWCAARAGEEIALSRWVETEVAAALSGKARLERAGDRLLAEARSRFAEVLRSSRRLPIYAVHFDLATRFASQPDTRLRSGDALHLAIAAEAAATLCTLDRRQADAAAILGVSYERI